MMGGFLLCLGVLLDALRYFHYDGTPCTFWNFHQIYRNMGKIANARIVQQTHQHVLFRSLFLCGISK
eukprot:2802714-Ditylum_brightwellii.AAC.2